MCTLKTLTELYITKQRIKTRNGFLEAVYKCFSNKNVLANHKENCLSINGAQSVKLEKRIIEFKNYCRQIHCPFKIYCGFKRNLEGVEIYEGFTQKITIIFFVVLLTKLFALMIALVSQLLFLGVKTLFMSLLKQFLKSMNTVKK